MKIYYDKLQQQLAAKLAPIYLISGDVPLLVQEGCDAIRSAARQQGFTERERHTVNAQFDWNGLTAGATHLSLFADKRIIELHLLTGKPGDKGNKALVKYCENLPEDIILLIFSGKLATNSQATRWYKAIDKIGLVVTVWPLSAKQMPYWLRQRMQQYELQTDNAGLQLLADRVEGNLLAATQEIEKLHLLYGSGRISADDMASAVADSSRFDVFKLIESALQQQPSRVIRIMRGLQAEGVVPTMVLWALAREIRTLASFTSQLQQGKDFASLCKQHRIWDRQKPMLQHALQRHQLKNLYRLLKEAQRIDTMIKGYQAGNIWDALLRLGLRLAA